MVPKISAFNSNITGNEKLFAKVKAVYQSEEQRVTWLTYNSFARNDATLKGEAKARYAAINQEVAGLQTQFANNILADEVINNYLLHYRTGEPIPADLVAKIKKATTFNEGFKTTEYLASAIIDLLYHTTPHHLPKLNLRY